MSQDPSIPDQLNSIIEYLNFHGHLFVRIASDRESDDIEGVDISPTSEIL
jgi:hypothetical protein